ADPDHLTRLARHEALAHQVEIGDAVDLVVIGDAGVAIAEADFGPHVKFDVAAAGIRVATKRAAGGPAVARERPGDFMPAAASGRRARADMLNGSDARQRTQRHTTG